MARIDWVRMKLENWARWSTQRDSNGLGFPSQTPFARMGGPVGRSEPTIPTMHIDASETDDAVQSLKPDQPHLHAVLVLHYQKGFDIHRVASYLKKANSTIKRNLEDADHAIARWYSDKTTNGKKNKPSTGAG